MTVVSATILSFFILTSAHAAQHGIAMHGALKYKEGQHFGYVNPNAPVGGEVKLGAVGTFDSLNPFITKGTAPAGLHMMSETLVFERLMIRSRDEPFSLYGLIAESVDVAPDRSWIQFNLRAEAKWADGKPITAEDVAFSHAILKEKGRPNLRLFYTKVKAVEVLGPRQIKFTFEKLPDEDRYDPELPLLIGLMAILPKHLMEGKDFEKLHPKDLIGSGPYRVKDVKMGRSIAYDRRKDYWGWNISCQKGYYNFQTVRYDYYRNETVALEAFKAGEYDVRSEGDPNHWLHDYNFKAVKEGKVIKEELDHTTPVGFKAFVFNIRRPIFEDKAVRQALAYAFDFEWANKTLFHGAFTRTRSYFDNTELACQKQVTRKEKEVLGEYISKVPKYQIDELYMPPNSKDAKEFRQNLVTAGWMLDKAGWIIRDGKRVNAKTGTPLEFEILLFKPDDEKLSLALARNLKRLGVTTKVRVVDPSQYERRRMDFDYDIIINSWGHSLSPGREQTYYWSTKAADEPGSRNYAGIRDPVVDHLCNVLATAKDRETLVAAARALDRSLLWGHYVIPLFHQEKIYLAYWNKFGHPEFRPDVPTAFITWWSKDAEKQGRDKK